MDMSENINELSAALVKAFAGIEGAIKDKDNPYFKSKYADLTSVVSAIKPHLVAHDLAFEQHCHPCERGVCVETIVFHASGQWKSFGKLEMPANKQDAQAYGSALTYARRYSLSSAFGVAPEDDDGNAASRVAPKVMPPTAEDIENIKANFTALAEASGMIAVREAYQKLSAPVKAAMPVEFFNKLKALYEPERAPEERSQAPSVEPEDESQDSPVDFLLNSLSRYVEEGKPAQLARLWGSFSAEEKAAVGENKYEDMEAICRKNAKKNRG